MSNTSSSSSSSGIGFIGLLTILFIGLKLTDHIDWSWWWVLAPIWLVPGLLVGFAGAVFAVAWVWDAAEKLWRRASR